MAEDTMAGVATMAVAADIAAAAGTMAGGGGHHRGGHSGRAAHHGGGAHHSSAGHHAAAAHHANSRRGSAQIAKVNSNQNRGNAVSRSHTFNNLSGTNNAASGNLAQTMAHSAAVDSERRAVEPLARILVGQEGMVARAMDMAAEGVTAMAIGAMATVADMEIGIPGT